MARRPISTTPPTPPTPRTPPTPTIAFVRSRPSLSGAPAQPVLTAAVASSGVTGEEILAEALTHQGEQYVFGARAPMANRSYAGPWDCAEFCSWCVMRLSGTLYGVRPADDAIRADAYTGYWAEDATIIGNAVSVEDALRIPGACLLRKPRSSRVGHIAFSDGQGGTMEAHSTSRGVIAHTAAGRRWDTGILVPGVQYFINEDEVPYTPPTRMLRLTAPLMRGPRVLALQTALSERGFSFGALDGIFGPQTEAGVQAFQLAEGLVPDGEVGPETSAALGL